MLNNILISLSYACIYFSIGCTCVLVLEYYSNVLQFKIPQWVRIVLLPIFSVMFLAAYTFLTILYVLKLNAVVEWITKIRFGVDTVPDNLENSGTIVISKFPGETDVEALTRAINYAEECPDKKLPFLD